MSLTILSLSLLENVLWNSRSNVNLIMKNFDSVDGPFWSKLTEKWKATDGCINVVLVGYRIDNRLPTIEDAQYEIVSLLPDYRFIEPHELAAVYCHLEDARNPQIVDTEKMTWREVTIFSRSHMLSRPLTRMASWNYEAEEKPAIYDISEMMGSPVKKYYRFALTPYRCSGTRLLRPLIGSRLHVR